MKRSFPAHAVVIWALLVFVGTGLAFTLAGCSGGAQAQVLKVSPQKGWALLQEHQNDTDFVVLDVRTPQEFAAGHIAGAVNIDYYSPAFREELSRLEKDKTYFVYCRTGHRSGEAVKIMKQLGFKKIYELRGGIVQWQAAGLPLTR